VSGPRHLPQILADITRLAKEQSDLSKAATGLKGHDKVRALRRCEELGRQIAKHRAEQLRAAGLK
jgi:hypothetical protein